MEICDGVGSTCGDMYSCDVNRLWCADVELWSPHVDICGGVKSTCGGGVFKYGDMWTYGVNM